MASFIREKETIKKNQVEMLEMNSIVIQIQVAFDWLSIKLNIVEKSGNLRIGQQKLPKLNHKEKKSGKNKETNKTTEQNI